MVQGSTTKNRGRFQTTTVHVKPQGRSGKNSNARCMVWIVRRDVLERAFDIPAVIENLMSQGILRYLISVGAMGTTYTLKPCLQLPSLGSIEHTHISLLELLS